MAYNTFRKDVSANDCDIVVFLIFPIRNKYFIYQNQEMKEGERMGKKNQVITYTQQELAKEVSNIFQGTYTVDEIRSIISCLEDCIQNHLTEAKSGEYIQIKVLNGISILSKLVPAQKNVNLFGINADIDSYLKIGSTITHYFKKKTNELAFDNK